MTINEYNANFLSVKRKGIKVTERGAQRDSEVKQKIVNITIPDILFLFGRWKEKPKVT